MLVLSRKKPEMIRIGDDIAIKVIHVGKSWVKIGIEAPEHVRVLRAELCDPPEAGHPLAEFLRERKAIRCGVQPKLSEPAPVEAPVPVAK